MEKFNKLTHNQKRAFIAYFASYAAAHEDMDGLMEECLIRSFDFVDELRCFQHALESGNASSDLATDELDAFLQCFEE